MSRDFSKPAKVVDAAGIEAALKVVQPGDTVRAVFYDEHYRTFEITGNVIQSVLDPNLFILGSWLLNNPTRVKGENFDEATLDRGAFAKGLKEFEILETSDRALF